MKSFLKAALTALACVFSIAPVSAAPLETLAREALLMDVTTGTVLFEKNADEMMTPSSMSKLMTLYVVFDRLKNGSVKLEDTFPVSERAWRMGGSKMFVELNNRIKVGDLIQGVAVQSGNDACVVLAEGLSGSEEDFALEMNRVAKEKLGLEKSHFSNASGWPDPRHQMTARELGVLGAHLIEDFPEYYPIFAEPEFTYHGIRQQNRNPLLGNGELGVDGLKTGHTEEAGYGIVMSAKQGERRLLLVVNGLSSMKERATETERLLRYGFREFEVQTPFKAGDVLGTVPVWMAKGGEVSMVVGEDVKVTLPRHNRGAISMSLEYQSPLSAPVKKGQQIGRLFIQFSEAEPRMVPVLAAEDVEPLSGFGRIWPALKYFMFMKE